MLLSTCGILITFYTEPKTRVDRSCLSSFVCGVQMEQTETELVGWWRKLSAENILLSETRSSGKEWRAKNISERKRPLKKTNVSPKKMWKNFKDNSPSEWNLMKDTSLRSKYGKVKVSDFACQITIDLFLDFLQSITHGGFGDEYFCKAKCSTYTREVSYSDGMLP